MKKQLKLDVISPCSENFNNFQPTVAGGFCSACQKQVVDFTRMTDDEIVQFFNKSTAKTCGRLKASQLKTYKLPIARQPHTGLKWIGTGLVGLSFLMAGKASQAQQKPVSLTPVEVSPIVTTNNEKDSESSAIGHTVKGKVVSEDGEVLSGVNVVIKGTARGTVTDINGQFTLLEVQGKDVLVFSFIGMVSTEFKIGKNSPELIEMKMVEMDFDFMGEIAVEGVYTSKSGFWHRLKALFQ